VGENDLGGVNVSVMKGDLVKVGRAEGLGEDVEGRV